MDITEIDLDSLTTLELWELHYRVAARLSRWGMVTSRGDKQPCLAENTAWDTHAARARMKALV